jgi:PAS domain S-box-containing protein
MDAHLIKEYSADPGHVDGENGIESDALGLGTWIWRPLENSLIWSNGVRSLLRLQANCPASWECWLGHVHEEDKDGVRRTLKTPPRGKGLTQVFSYRLIRNDGSVVHMEDRRHWDESGSCQGVFIDVTRASVYRESYNLEAHCRRSIEAAGIGIFRRDFTTGRDYWNDALYEICDLPKSVLPPVSDHLLPVHHPKDASMVRSQVDNCRLTGTPLCVDYRITTAAGEERWLRERGQHLKAADGKLLAYCGVVENITHEKARLQQLEKSRQFLALVLSCNNMAVWEWNRKTDTQIWSEEFFRLIGYEPGEVTPGHEAWSAALHPDDRDWAANFSMTVVSGEVHAFTYRVLVAGSIRWIRESWKDVTADDGTEEGASVRRGISADVTDWKERENSFRITDNWLRLAVDGGRIGLWSHDTFINRYHWNDHIYSLLGYHPGAVEPSEEAWNARIHPEDIERVKAEVANVRVHGGEIATEYRVVLPDNSVRWLEERGRSDDAYQMRHGILLDITDRKSLQQQIESGRQRLQLALDTGGMGFWTGHAGEEEWDERTYQLLGYEPFSVKPSLETFLQALHPEDRRTVETFDEIGVITRGKLSNEYRVMQRDGTVRWIESTRRLAAPGTPDRYGVVVDITERKTREELHLRSERLEAAGRLLSGLAHDFNNFLAIINATLEPLCDSAPDPETASRLSEARHVTTVAALFSRRLVNISKERRWEPQLLSIGALISDLIAIVRPIMKRDIELWAQVPFDLWQVNVDPLECESAIINLLMNARDAISSGGSITVSASNQQFHADAAAGAAGAGDYVVVTVRDTGKGMDQETLRMSKEPFFTTKSAGSGTGLGLSSVDAFAASAGGHMSIESAPGEGTVVSLHLPRAREPNRAIHQPEPTTNIPLGHGELVLIVDDDHYVRGITMQRVEALGYAVEEAPDAVSALQTLQSVGGFDLVLSDVSMPGPMNGLDLNKRLAAEMPKIPIVLITAHEHLVGDDDQIPILSKSCGQRELAQALATALASRRKQ